MRRCCFVFLLGWLLAFTAPGATPELGKDALRKLVKLPTIAFEPAWKFDSERGFTLASSDHDAATEIETLEKQLKHDASDAETELRLGNLHAELNDSAAARKSWTLAAELFRKRVEMQPDDASLLTKFGQALAGAGKPEEAESVLRKAVELAPKDWKCRVALGRFLDAEARRNIHGDPEAGIEPLTPPRVTLARRELAEAGECFDQATTMASAESEVYMRRGLHRCLRTSLLNQVRLAEGEQKNEVLQANRQFSEAALADLQQASRLNSSDYALIGSTVLFEIYTVSSRQGRMNWADFSWSSLPEKTQRSIREAEARLENLGQDPDAHQAAGALEVLGILQGPVLREQRSCIGTLRRAVALDPSREEAWDVLSATLAQSQRYDELLDICENRIQEKESYRAHLLLAKTYEKLRDWDDSENEIMEALRMAPNSFQANLAEAALILRRGEDADTLMDANSWLSRSERLMGELPQHQRSQDVVIELTLMRSIYFALTDQLDEAREWAHAVIGLDKNNGVAQDILTAMDY